MVIATKVRGRPTRPSSQPTNHADGLAPAVLREQADRSRERLGVDRIDLYYAHIPDMWHGTPLTDTVARCSVISMRLRRTRTRSRCAANRSSRSRSLPALLRTTPRSVVFRRSACR